MYIKRFTLNDMKHTIKTAFQDRRFSVSASAISFA